MRILINAPLDEAHVRTIQRLFPQVEFKFVPPEQTPTVQDLQNVEVLYTNLAGFEPADAPSLKLVQLNTAAANLAMDKPVWRSDLPLATVSGAYTTAVAECAWAMLLALTRRIPTAVHMQDERNSDVEPLEAEELYGRTLGIVGYGSIGRHIARIAQAVGMRVLACKRDPQNRRDTHYMLPNTGDPDGIIPEVWYGIAQIVEMVSQCDVVIVTLPLTRATAGLIDGRVFGAISSHAYFLNIGRGPVVDEPALIECLRAGAIKGAALDVTVEEPLPDESPLWDMPNVLLLPHIASYTDKQSYRAGELLIENLKRVLDGKEPFNLVDRELMY